MRLAFEFVQQVAIVFADRFDDACQHRTHTFSARAQQPIDHIFANHVLELVA